VTVSIELTVNKQPAGQEVYDAISQLEVEESSDQPGSLLLRLKARRTKYGDLQFVGDGTFEPMTNVALTISYKSFGGHAVMKQCVFDGYVLSWRLHLGAGNKPAATIDIRAQDASWLMNLDDTIVEWRGLTDGEIANAIFAKYGFVPSSANTDHDSPPHTPDGHTMVQRATDLQFLRSLARRGGKLCRVACTDTPGLRTGYFVVPDVSSKPVTTILAGLNPFGLTALDFDWDVMRPTSVNATQIDLTQSSKRGTDVAADSSGLKALDSRDYSAYFGGSSTLQLTAPADLPELSQRTAAVLVESGFFARCTGHAVPGEIDAILRVGDLVSIDGAGNLLSGNWLVWQVRHTFSPDREQGLRTSTMAFTLLRNAVGPAQRAVALPTVQSTALA
jgi:hypothetical protein